MFQAAVLIEAFANSGKCDSTAFDCSFDSLFTFDAPTPLAVYGQVDCLDCGFDALVGYLGGQRAGSSRNIAYYVLSMMKIAAAIQSSSSLAGTLLQALQEIKSSSEDFELSRSSQIGKIDALYRKTISRLTPRIMVRGEQTFLLNEDTAARIRTLLLAGIRSAVLWRQLGGSKWKLFLRRKKYVAVARAYLSGD